MNQPEPRPLPAPIAVAIGLGVLAVGWPSLIYPFGRDQGNYAYAAQVILDGGAPYLDVFLFKPPGAALVHMLPTMLLGPTEVGIRLLDLGLVAVGAALLADLVRRATGSLAGAIVAGGALPLVIYPLRHWDLAQPDGWLGLAVVAGVWLAARAPSSARAPWALWLGAGVCLGLATAFKYSGALFGLALLPLLLGAGSWRRAAGWLGAAALGWGLVVGALAAWIVAHGAGSAFVDSQLGLVPAYVANTPRESGLGAFDRLFRDIFLRRTLGSVGVALGFGAVGAAVLAAVGAPRERRLIAVGAIWSTLAIFAVYAQGKFFTYHYAPLFAPAALFAGLGIAVADRWVSSRAPAWVGPAAACGILLLGAAVGPIRERQRDVLPVLLRAQTVVEYRSNHPWYVRRNYAPVDVARTAAWLRANTQASDRAFHWGFEPGVNYLADRRTGSRFLYNYPFRMEWANQDYRRELLDALRADPPEFFVVSSGDATLAVTGSRLDSSRLLRAWRELSDLVDARYQVVAVVGRYKIYQRRDLLSPAPGADAAAP